MSVHQMPVRRGRQPIIDGRRSFDLFPHGWGVGHVEDAHWVYMAVLPDGGIKVGITAYPRRRFGALWTHFGELQSGHLFGGRLMRHEAYVIERKVLHYLVGVGGSRRAKDTEVIDGVSKTIVMEAVRRHIAAVVEQRAAKAAAHKRPTHLAEWLSSGRGRAQAMTEAFGVTKGAISHWKKHGPPMSMYQRIEKHTNGAVSVAKLMADAIFRGKSA